MLHCCFVVACEGTGTRIDMDVNRSSCLQKCSARCALLYLSSQRLLKKPQRAERVGGGFGRGYVSYQIKQVAIKHRKLFPPHSGGGKIGREDRAGSDLRSSRLKNKSIFCFLLHVSLQETLLSPGRSRQCRASLLGESREVVRRRGISSSSTK